MTRAQTATAATLTATLGVAALGWAITVRQMDGMEMGVATPLGSPADFAALWCAMTAAMMLPSAAPALVRIVRECGRIAAVPLFVASYLAVWTLVGVAVYALDRPHGTLAAGAIAIAAGLYEMTPLKRRFRRRCREDIRSGFAFGLCCVGSCIGLMLMMAAASLMSVAWMGAVTVVVVAQKLLPDDAAIDVPLALAIVGLGSLMIVAPSTIPGLMPAM